MAAKRKNTEEELPHLDEADVSALATAKVFDRGQDILDQNALIDPVRQGFVLRAGCQGSAYDPYAVSAVLSDSGIEQTNCTCPYDFDGICKHEVALLLAWVYTPEIFRSVLPLEQLLEPLDRSALQNLIAQLIEQDPDLLPWVEAACSTASVVGKKSAADRQNIADYKKRTSALLKKLADTYLDDWGEDRRSGNREMGTLRTTAKALVKAKRIPEAAAYDAVLLEELNSHYSGLSQLGEDGVLYDLAEECGNTLVLAIPTADDRTRLAYLQLLLRVELRSRIQGGLELPPKATDAIVKSKPQEWASLEKLIHQNLQDATTRRQESVIDLLQQRLRYEKRESEIPALIRKFGSPDQRIKQLLAEKNIKGAIEVAKEHYSGRQHDLLRFANLLIEAKAPEEAEALVLPLAKAESNSYYSNYAGWLVDFYSRRENWENAWKWQLCFCKKPLLEPSWKQLRELGQKLGDWPQRRAKFEAALNTKRDARTLLQIAVWENDAPRAVELFQKLPKNERYGFGESVALLAETDFPEFSLELYGNGAILYIEQRNRPAYQSAIKILKRMKALHKRTESLDLWDLTVDGLRTKYKTLRAFQEELNKAHL